MFPNSGPGSYNSNQIEFLKRFPRVTIGNSKRMFLGKPQPTPGPDTYSTHNPMTKRRNSSGEWNAPRCVIGQEPKESK